MHNTLVFATFPLHSSVFYHSTERFVKFGAVLHHDLCRCVRLERISMRHGVQEQTIGRKKCSRLLTWGNVFFDALATN